MSFVNPIEILELHNSDVSSIDNLVIKKAKRKLFADIDLSDDGHYTYKGHSLTKTECEKVIEQLDNQILVEFYLHLANNKQLNDYLATQDETIFTSFKLEGIYKLPEFIQFISPHFATKFDKSLLRAFKDNNVEKVKSILRTMSLINMKDYGLAFKSLSNELQHRIEEVNKVTSDIKNEETEYSEDDIEEVSIIVEDLFPVEVLNLLPAYFQSQINKAAAAINFLSIAIWNEFSSTIVPLKLLEQVLRLNIESVSKPTFEKNYKIYKDKHHERIEQEKNAPTLKKWASILLSVQSQIKLVENKSLNSGDALNKIKELVSISDLNNLPSFANEIRTQIGYSIRSLSISCWNKQSDIKSALGLINLALQINASDEAKLKFKQDKAELEELERKYKGILICHFCEKNPPSESCGIKKTIYKETYRSYFPRRVQFTYSELTIPRCNSCQTIHSKGNEKFQIIFWITLVIGVIIGAVTEGEHFVIGGIIGAVVGWIIATVVEGNQVTNQGIKDASNSSLSKHPLLIERMREGWTFSKPSA